MASIAASSIAVQPRRTLAIGRVSGLKLGSFMNQGRSRLSFRMRPMPARLQICCAANKETLDKVCDIVRDKLSVVKSTSVTGESTFEGLGADSLDTVELVMALEEEFDIQMDEEAAQNIKTVQDAAELIEKLGNK